MSKSKKKTQQPDHEKGFIELAGEAMHVLGQEIAEGKDKLVAVTVETFTDVKEAVKKKFAKKKTVVKKAVKKAAPKKKPVVKKSATVKKAEKKVSPKKKKK
jgi:hypothetical protein